MPHIEHCKPMLLQQCLPVRRVLEEHRTEGAVNTGRNCSFSIMFVQHHRRPSSFKQQASHIYGVTDGNSHFFCCLDAGQTCSVGDLHVELGSG